MARSAFKRPVEEVANKSASSDEDYDEHQPRSRKSKLKSSKKPAPKRRKRSTGYGSGDEDDDDESSLSEPYSDEIQSEQDDPTLERNARGTVKRRVAKRTNYQDPSSEDELPAEPNFDSDSDSDAPLTRTAKGRKGDTRRLLLKLRLPKRTKEATASPPAARPSRATRARSTSIKGSSDLLARFGNRRSTRLTRDESEDMIALTNSGHHVETVRKGTASPEVVHRSRKTITTKSVIVEEEEEAEGQEDDATGMRKDEADVGSQVEVMESDPQQEPEDEEGGRLVEEPPAVAASDAAQPDENAAEVGADVEMADEGYVPESQHDNKNDADEDEEAPRSRRRTRIAARGNAAANDDDNAQEQQQQGEEEEDNAAGGGLRRSSRRTTSKNRRHTDQDEGSDFEPPEEDANDDDVSDSEVSHPSPRKGSQNTDEAEESAGDRRSRLRKRQSQSRAESEADGLVEELAELKTSRLRRRERPPIVYEDKPRRTRKSVDYRIIRPELNIPLEDDATDVGASPSRRPRNGGGSGWQRSLFSTYGPFGGAGGPPPLLGGPTGMGATGGVESDSSDEDSGQRAAKPGTGATTGMTPTTALPPQGLSLGVPQAHTGDAIQGTAGTPANLGRIKDRQTLADSDPLGVDPNVNFDSVGGLQGHIDQLKEMVSLPLLYPEIFQRFHIVPPRGVLFHGPPGTGKTLLARALATSVSSEGRKVTFYMRKGADALSKWVGEAERQLRLLFEEARKTQPSIIFFDEIDGLAPVRSSKQEQIHASIVSTLLALMDGMDGRGQVIVIGATNRPDSIDPALRRPGRFDREFYFPLPNTEARRQILDIHTKGWDPPLANDMKDELAELTKGYGGADLRALCTEAALNAVQRKYPQIYRSNVKLLIDPKKIEVGAKDFMISLKKMVPSSERSASSAANPLPGTVEPLLRERLRAIKEVVAEMMPMKKRLTALEEAQFEEPEDQVGFRRERMQQAFETSRVFRPRLLIHGQRGMGQQYIAAALLHHFEGMHVQPFDLPTLLGDSSRSPEATIVQLFTEVKRHKPSVIYIPDITTWYQTVGTTVLSTFLGLLRSLAPTDPVLVLGVAERESGDGSEEIVKTVFSYSTRSSFELKMPTEDMRREFFKPLIDFIRISPSDFPDPVNRKRRKLEPLPRAPPTAAAKPAAPSKEELKAQKKKDRQTLNLLKIRIQPIMDQIKKYKRFRTGVVDESHIRYLFDEQDSNVLTSDLPIGQRAGFRPYEKDVDKYGVPGLREVATSKFYYNMEIVTIEKRLSNGYYTRPKDFLVDIKRIAKDARELGDQDRLIKANELLSNVEVDVGVIEQTDPNLVAECEQVYTRQLERERLALEKAKRNDEVAAGRSGSVAAGGGDAGGKMGPPPSLATTTAVAAVAHGISDSSNQSSGPVVLGEPFPPDAIVPPYMRGRPVTPGETPTQRDSLTNGNSYHQFGSNAYNSRYSNGSNVIHRNGTDHEGDIQMSMEDNSGIGIGGGADNNNNTQNSSFGQSAQPRPPHSYTAPSQQMRQQSGLSNLSQRGTMTPMAPGSQPGDYANDASTTQTTSDKKHSGPSDIHSQAYLGLSGRHDGPDLTQYPDRVSGDEHLPDTQQGDSSWASSQHTPLPGVLEYAQSQASVLNGSQPQPQQQHRSSQQRSHHQQQQPPVPPFDASPRPPSSAQRSHPLLQNILNAEDSDGRGAGINNSNNNSNPDLIVDNVSIDHLHTKLAKDTHDLSVEELQQINTSLMDCVWKTRGEWNRATVVNAVMDTFTTVLADMMAV